MCDIEEDWATLRRNSATPIASVEEPSPDMIEEWRELQGLQEFGYIMSGQFWDELAIWKIRILGKASASGRVFRKEPAYKFEKVELIWCQERARTEKTHVLKESRREIKVFHIPESQVDHTLMDVTCRVGAARDKYRMEQLNHRTALHQSITRMQAEIEESTRKISELDKFNPNGVVPSDLLDAEEVEMERVFSELTK